MYHFRTNSVMIMQCKSFNVCIPSSANETQIPPLVVRERFSEEKPKAILACNLISEIPAVTNQIINKEFR